MGDSAADLQGSSVMTLRRARSYFGLQAVAGALWWISVFLFADVRRLTLGDWDPWLLLAPDVALFVFGSLWVAILTSRFAAMVVAIWTVGVTVALVVYGLIERAAGLGAVAMTVATIGTVVSALTVGRGRLPTEWFFQGPFAFRPAGDAGGATHVRRSLAQLLVFWTAFFVAVPIAVSAVERRLDISLQALDDDAWVRVGWFVFALGSALGLWSCLTMALVGQGTPLPAETARKLVIRGPYRYVRNPMAVAGAFQTAAIGLVVGSWIVIVLAVAGAVIWDALIRPAEEADLATRFGDDYEHYRDNVRCWIPTRRT